MSSLHLSNFYFKSIYVKFPSLMGIFFVAEPEEVAKLKCYAAHLEWEGFQELALAMVGTPVSQLVNLVSARVHKAGESAPSSSGAPSPSVEGQWAPLIWALSWREPIVPLPQQCQWPQRRGGNSAGGTTSHGPLWGHCLPSGSSQLLLALQGNLQSPATSLNSHFLPDPSCEST